MYACMYVVRMCIDVLGPNDCIPLQYFFLYAPVCVCVRVCVCAFVSVRNVCICMDACMHVRMYV